MPRRKDEYSFADDLRGKSEIEETYNIQVDNNYFKLRNRLMKQYGVIAMRDEINNSKKSAKEREKIEVEIINRIRQAEAEAAAIALKTQETVYKKAGLVEKQQILQNSQKKRAEIIKTQQEELASIEAIAKITGKTDSLRATTLRKNLKSLHKQQVEDERAENKLKIANIRNQSRYGTAEEKKQARQSLKQLRTVTQERIKGTQLQISDEQLKLEQMKKSGASEEDIQDQQYLIETLQDNLVTQSQILQDAKYSFTEAIEDLKDTISSAYEDAYKQAEKIVMDNQSVINARMQGTEKSFLSMTDLVTDMLSFSPIVKMQDVINNINKASDLGIMYNIEQRAFLETVSDKIADTFDAFDSNLLRLIRLQQADTTAARLGMEASLTKLFNSTFNDSSYLNDVYDAVSSAIIDANSQLSKQESTAFEYTLQKWLGSLYSLGLSSTTVTQIAEGVNYLATGNVSALASNNSLQTLMAMSASNAGLDFAELMLEGLDAESTNKLLQSMVLYLKDIAENSDSQVVKSAYGDIFNMSLSDLTAFSNITTSEIANLASINYTEGDFLRETESQLQNIVTRSTIAENLSNLYNNALYGMALDMAANPATWAMDKVLKFMQGNNIDMNIPFISVLGSGLDLNTTVVGLLQTALGFSKAISLFGTILGVLGSEGGTNLDAWGGTEYNQRSRGSSIGGLLSTMLGGTSSSTAGSYVASGSSDDYTTTALADATSSAEDTAKITNANAEIPERTIDDVWKATVGSSATDFFKVKDDFLNNVYDSNRSLRVLVTNDSITARITNLSTISESLKTSLNQITLSPNTVIRINEESLIAAITKALGGSEVAAIRLQEFITNSIDGTNPPTFKVKQDNMLAGALGAATGILGGVLST